MKPAPRHSRVTPLLVTPVLAALALCLPATLALGADVVVQAGRVVTSTGTDFAEGGSVLIRGGRIAEVREGFVNPWGAEVRKHEQAWLMPGFVEAHSQLGLDRGNEQAPNTPFVSVLDGIDPLSTYFVDLLRDGVTTVFVVPGDATLIGGQGLVLKPVGRTAEEMIIKRQAGMKIAVAPRRGTSRMAQLAELRRAFDSARRSEGDQVLDDPDGPDRDPSREALIRLLSGELPAVIACDQPVDVSNAQKLMRKNGLRGFLKLGPGCARALSFIADQGLPVLLPDDLEPLETDAETGEERRRELAREFGEAGVMLAVHASESSPYGRRSLWYQAATAVKQGVSRTDAIQAITVNPAKLLGVDDRVGTVAPDRDANFALWTGDPLDPASWVDEVYIGGEVVYERAKDRVLARLVSGPTGDEEEGR